MLTRWFAAPFALSSVPISLALTYDPYRPFTALYGVLSCRDLSRILGLPVREICARVTRGCGVREPQTGGRRDTLTRAEPPAQCEWLQCASSQG